MSLTGEAKKRADAARYERIKADPELLDKRRAKAREATKRHREKLRSEQPEKLRALYRKQNLKHNYGLSPDDVAAMLSEQDHRCKICREVLLAENGRRNCKRGHVVDHCHTTGKVRGILCHRCNQGLGLFRDNAEHLSQAIQYLKGV